MVYGPEEKLIKGNLTITGDGSGTLDLKELEVKGDLIVNLPNATVKNHAKVEGYVKIDDISENTWIELVDNNKLIFASKNDTLIIPDKIKPKSVELKTETTVVTSKEITVKAKKDIKILVKSSEEDAGVEIGVKTEDEYECVTLSNKVSQADIDKEIESRKEVKNLINKIESLDDISLEDAEKVASIRTEYDALEEDKKALIPNLWKLEEAEDRIVKLEEEKVEETLEKIGSAKDLEALEAIKINDTLSDENKAKLKEAKVKKKLDLEENKEIEDGIKEDYEKNKEIIDDQEQEIADYYIAQAVVDEIEALGKVTLDSKGRIEQVRTAYDSLTDKQKTFVTNLKILEEAENKIIELVEEKVKEEAEKAEADRQAKIVEKTLGEIKSADTIEALEAIKIDDTLSEVNQAKLKEAKDKKKLDLEEDKKIEHGIKEDYEKDKQIIDEQEQEIVDYYNQQFAKEASDKIDLIPSLDKLILEDISIVESARKEYNSLTEEQKKLVENLEILETAETKIQELEEAKAKEEADKEAAKMVDNQIADLGEISLESKEAVEAVRAAYDTLTKSQQEFVDNLDALEGAEVKLDNLRKEAFADLEKNISDFEATAIRLLNQQGRFHLEKVRDNEINFEFLTNGGSGVATETTSMTSYIFKSGLATVLGQKSDTNGKAQKARIEAMKKYIDMDTATIDGESFGGLTGMSKIYRMKVGDFLGTKTGKVKVKSEIVENMYLEYTINFSLPENK